MADETTTTTTTTDPAKAAANATAAELVTRGLDGLSGGNRAGGDDKATPTPGSQTATAANPGGTTPGAADAAKDGAAAAAGAAAAKPGDAPAPEGYVKAADVEKMIEAAMAKQGNDRQAQDTRERFIHSKMADLPVSIQGLMPKTANVGELARAEQQIRGELKDWMTAEMKRAGIKVANVSGGDHVGGTSSAPAMQQPNATPSDLVSQALARLPDPILHPASRAASNSPPARPQA